MLGFDTLWDAAVAVDRGFAPPERYPHHRLGSAERLAELATSCGWQAGSVETIIGVRSCDDAELWQWLWGSLPLLRLDGSYAGEPERASLEAAIRAEFFARATGWRTGDRYLVQSHALLLRATANG